MEYAQEFAKDRPNIRKKKYGSYNISLNGLLELTEKLRSKMDRLMGNFKGAVSIELYEPIL